MTRELCHMLPLMSVLSRLTDALLFISPFLGGNQRDSDREKAQKKAAAMQKKPKESATSLQKRKEA